MTCVENYMEIHCGCLKKLTLQTNNSSFLTKIIRSCPGEERKLVLLLFNSDCYFNTCGEMFDISITLLYFCVHKYMVQKTLRSRKLLSVKGHRKGYVIPRWVPQSDYLKGTMWLMGTIMGLLDSYHNVTIGKVPSCNCWKDTIMWLTDTIMWLTDTIIWLTDTIVWLTDNVTDKYHNMTDRYYNVTDRYHNVTDR